MMRRTISSNSNGLRYKVTRERSKNKRFKLKLRGFERKESIEDNGEELGYNLSHLILGHAKWLLYVAFVILLSLLGLPYLKKSQKGSITRKFDNKPLIHRYRGYDENEEEGRAWELSWREAGWYPVVLSIEDAEKHEKFEEYMWRLSSSVDEIARPLYLRYIAMAIVEGGGWLADITAYPLHLADHSSVNALPNGGVFTSHDLFVPSLFSASQAEWDRVSDLIIYNARNPSDLHALKDMMMHNTPPFIAQKNILEASHVFTETFQTGDWCDQNAIAIRFAKPDIPSTLHPTPVHKLARQWFHIYFHKCLLQHNERPILYTYFEPIPSSETNLQTLQAIESWKQIWYMAGWLPLVLNENDAKRHAAYSLFISASTSFNNITLQHRHKHSFLRWLAVASSAGNWMADYDLIPMQLRPKQTTQLPYEGNLTVYAQHTPCLVSGSVDEYNRIIDILYNTLKANMPTPYYPDNSFMWNDMLALKDIYHTTGAFHSLSQVTNFRQIYNHQYKCDSIQPHIKAIHFSPYDIDLLYKQNLISKMDAMDHLLFYRWFEEYTKLCSNSRKHFYFDDYFEARIDIKPLTNLRILTLGSSTTWGARLYNRYDAYPYLLSPDVTNLAIRGSGPNYPSICTQTLIGNDNVYDIIILEYFSMVYDGLMQLVKRLRQRFPDAILIYMMAWNPTMIGYHDKNDQYKWRDPQVWSKQLGFQSTYMKSALSLKAFADSKNPWQFTDKRHLQQLKNIVRQAKDLGNGYIYEWDMGSDNDDDNDNNKVNAQHEMLKKANYFAVDWLHLSRDGHEKVARDLIEVIHKLMNTRATPIPNNDDNVGTWGSGDTCFFWYESGDIDNQFVQYSENVKLEKFSKAWNKFALEIIDKSWIQVVDADTKNIVDDDNMRQVIITYMVTNANKKIYPKVQVEILGQPLKNERNKKVIINPVTDAFGTRDVHVTSSSSVGFVKSDVKDVKISITPLEIIEAPFRVISIILGSEDAVVSDNFGGGDDISWINN